MAQHGSVSSKPRRRRKHVESRPRKGKRESSAAKASAGDHLPSSDKPADLKALRKAHLKYFDKPAAEGAKKMKYVGETTTRVPARKVDVQHVHSTPRSKSRRKASEAGVRHRQSKSRPKETRVDEYESVYRKSEGRSDPQARRARLSEEEQHHAEGGSPQREASPKSSIQKDAIPRLPPDRDMPMGQQGRTSRRRQNENEGRSRHSRRDLKSVENTSTRQRRHTSRPALNRTTTSTTITRSKSDAVPTSTSGHVRSTTGPASTMGLGKKGSSIFASLLRSSTATQASLKKVSCLICGVDDIPSIRTAKLACGHRMCRGCLRRIFTLSIDDPAHMPPRCCTSDHIPLKYVDNLFDQKFKKTWNRKFAEYSTKNRIYCPVRHCGEWIKPSHISVEDGRKVGKCKKCKTRVCCTCNLKMHTSRECPRDPATKLFVEMAKQEGWKRCFNCSAMVELKEGCNHMTCRCTAEFCMVCSRKWKTCDCPWFNYDTVEADRLEHMCFPGGPIRANRQDRRDPIRYQHELDQRRRQERQDEALARRLQTLGVDDDAIDDPHEVNDNPGHVFGIGNAAGHFLNNNFRHTARNVVVNDIGEAARAADGFISGAITGRENPLPPSPLELDNPAETAVDQTEQLLCRDNASGTASANDNTRTRPTFAGNHRGGRTASHGNSTTGSGRAADYVMRSVALEVAPLQTFPASFRRTSDACPAGGAHEGVRVVSGDVGGRSYNSNVTDAGQRIEAWRSEVPAGMPDGDLVTDLR